jgi:hypothetical protein|tara:strand:+ start:557 stop:892 length:336 start_codon:yes stop_codon:yes gene_type:complete
MSSLGGTMNKREREYNKTFSSKNSKRFILNSNEFIYKGFLLKRRQIKDLNFIYYDITNDHNPAFATGILSPQMNANNIKDAREAVDDLLRDIGVPAFRIYNQICGHIPSWE